MDAEADGQYKLPAALEKERTAKSRLRKHVWPRLLSESTQLASELLAL